jgi:hypothetical protein
MPRAQANDMAQMLRGHTVEWYTPGTFWPRSGSCSDYANFLRARIQRDLVRATRDNCGAGRA